MTVKSTRLALVSLLGLALTAPAQAPPQEAAAPHDRNTKVPAPGPADREIQEDIAVFRLPPTRPLTRYSGLPTSFTRPHGVEAHQLPQVEGVYLTGHGVVFSVSVPPTPDPLGKPQAPAKPV